MENLTLEELNELMAIINKVVQENTGKTEEELGIPVLEVHHYIKASSTYHPSQRKAIKQYINNNRDKYNEYHRNRHKEKMETDPEYKIKFQQRMRGYYQKRKNRQNEQETQGQDGNIEINEEINNEIEAEELN
jgi:hypothetical protein